MRILVDRDSGPHPDDAQVEIVERKGLGHPDSICDAIAEELSRELCLLYLERTGTVLHHNVDKALLIAGAAVPEFGGGRVTAPMQMIVAGQAVLEVEGRSLDVDGLADDVARRWFAENLHSGEAARDLVVSTGLRQGSSELVELFASDHDRIRSANDTSCGVGYAPLSELEQAVLAIEQQLNSAETRAFAPALGEDVKVMAVRRDSAIKIIVSVAMIGSALRDMADYLEARETARQIALQAARKITALPVEVEVNVGDDIPSGRIFLTVTGTSAEAGDDGQAGRGNRVNGLITPCRPMTIESVAGKNPITHVGKLYNFAAGLIADSVVREIPEVHNAECRIVSAIGAPIDEPELLEVRVMADPVRGNSGLAHEIERLAREELKEIPGYSTEFLTRSLQIGRWPLRR